MPIIKNLKGMKTGYNIKMTPGIKHKVNEIQKN